MKTHAWPCLAFTILLACAPTLRQPIQFEPNLAPWADAPPSMPAGTKISILEGSPKERGMFTIRLRVPAGARVAPHTHPREERVTVLSGSVLVGFGETFDASKGHRFGPGAFYVNPPDAPHFVWTEEGAEVQITGRGPWVVRPLEPPSGA